MTSEISAYHQRVSTANREAILEAAAQLFLESGYDRTSLARVAKGASVSKATLYKQFPTKAELFEATLLWAGDTPGAKVELPRSGDLHAGLVALGRAYADLLSNHRMVALMRTLIAESPQFPELSERTFNFGTLTVLAALKRYLSAESAAGTATVDDPDLAATQFLGMIATVVFWPRLVHAGWSLADAEVSRVVDEAAMTMVARYG